MRVVAMNETDDSSEVVLNYENPRIPNMVRRGSFLLTLQGLGGDKPTSITLKIVVSADGMLRAQLYGAGNA